MRNEKKKKMEMRYFETLATQAESMMEVYLKGMDRVKSDYRQGHDMGKAKMYAEMVLMFREMANGNLECMTLFDDEITKQANIKVEEYQDYLTKK